MNAIVRHKRGTTTQWSTATYVLKQGEIGFDTTLNKAKVGNGTALWAQLPWLHVTPTELTTQASSTLSAANSYTDSAVTSLGNSSMLIYVPIADVGQPDGVASLDANGKVPDSQIPSTIARDSEIPSLTGYATETFVNTAISNLVDAAPTTLNTLNELAAALGDDANYATTISTALGNKLDSSTASSTYLTQSNASSTYAPLSSPTFTGTVTLPANTSGANLINIPNSALSNSSITINGSAISLGGSTTVDSLPPQSTNSGKYLTTNGTVASWATIPVTSAATQSARGTLYGLDDSTVTFIGYQAGLGITSPTGSKNTLIGANAGYAGGTGDQLTTGSNNIIIGYDAIPSSPTVTGEITLGTSGAITRFRIPGIGIDWSTDETRPASKLYTRNPQAGSYPIVVGDLNKLIEMSGGGNLTITDSSSFPEGFTVDVLQTTSSQVTIVGGGSTVVNGTPGLKLRAQWSSATLIKRGTNLWVAIGDLAP